MVDMSPQDLQDFAAKLAGRKPGEED